MIDVLGGEVALILTADDIERVYREGKHGVIIDFQDTIPFGTDIERIDLFYNLGLRQVQLTYNLRNLVGDGCTEHNASGITYFGRTVVERLNELNMIVDVSHCSEAVGWDAIELSTSPVIVSHSNAKAVTYHDRAKSDEARQGHSRPGRFLRRHYRSRASCRTSRPRRPSTTSSTTSSTSST